MGIFNRNKQEATPLSNLKKMVKYVNTHLEHNHDLNNPELLTDLYTLRDDLNTVLDAFGSPTPDQRLAFLVREVVKIKKDTADILEILDGDNSF